MSDEQDVELPEMDSFTITATTQFEIDLSEEQQRRMMEQTGQPTLLEAIEAVFAQRERESVEPEQKLLGVNVTADQS